MSISTRVLRKFAGDKDIICSNIEDVSDIDETPFSSGSKKKHLNANRYDLLNIQSQSESEVKEDDDSNDQEGKVSPRSHVRESSKRKKKKKRKKTTKSNHKQSSDDVDEVERSIQEVNAMLGDVVTPVQAKDDSSANNKKKGILYIEHKHLNPKNELKRIFGSKIIQPQKMKKKGHSLIKRTVIKNTWLISPREHWLPLGKLGLSMKILETKNNIQYFTFEHNLYYQSIQKKFLEAVESMDPDNIMMVANQSPYHVDAMIQLSDIFKLSDDLPMAAELVERALFACESGFHPLFNVTKGNCRLDYRRQENRSFYVALFKHLTFVGQRACYRTALEFCKLLFSLDPEKDPLAIVLVLDFYALRSREFEWFLQFIEEMDHVRNLSQLPNIAFSKAVALYQLSDPTSDAVLQDALLMFPGVLFPLLDNCGVQPDPKTQVHPYFSNASSSRIPALDLLIQLYVHRNFHIWKEPDVLSWLEKNTLEVLKRVDAKDPLVLEYAQKRSRRFEAKTPREIQRHVFLSDIKKVTAVLAEIAYIGTTFGFDPLPPPDSINIYPNIERPRRAYARSNPLTLYFRSLMPNFQALTNIPEMNGGEPEAPAPPPPPPPPAPASVPAVAPTDGGGNEAADSGGGESGGGGGHVHFQNSVRNLLDAMRNLLSNLHPDRNQDILSDIMLISDEDEDDENENEDEDEEENEETGERESPL